LIELDSKPHQVRLVVEMDPRFGIHRLVKAITGRSSGVLR
jgi:putative transposase